MMNTTVDWKDLNSLHSNCCTPFSQLLYSSFYIKIIVSKSTIIIKYWRNTTNYEIYIHFYLLKLPTCGFEGPKNNINQCWIWNTTLPYKFVNSWSFMHVTEGFLQINLCMKPTLRITLQTKFQYSSTLKCMVHRLPYYYSNSIAFIQNIEIREVEKCLHPQCHLQSIDSTEANWVCTEHERK